MSQVSTLIVAFERLQQANRELLKAPKNRNWPNDPWTNKVQGLGMAFATKWNESKDYITSVVNRNPSHFPFFHVTDKKGNRPDPTNYSHAPYVMNVLVRQMVHEQDGGNLHGE